MTSISVLSVSKTTVLISRPLSQPFSTLTIPGCPARAALPTSYQPTSKITFCRSARAVVKLSEIEKKLTTSIKIVVMIDFIVMSPHS
jgi:hypothetical protein